ASAGARRQREDRREECRSAPHGLPSPPGSAMADAPDGRRRMPPDGTNGSWRMDETANPAPNPVLAEIWRGGMLECVHRGTAVICRPDGSVSDAWGDPERVILPRSSCKMVQALPLVESGAADAAGLTERHL